METAKKECDHGVSWRQHCDDCAKDGETTYERMSRDKETAMYLAILAYVMEETEQAVAAADALLREALEVVEWAMEYGELGSVATDNKLHATMYDRARALLSKLRDAGA